MGDGTNGVGLCAGARVSATRRAVSVTHRPSSSARSAPPAPEAVPAVPPEAPAGPTPRAPTPLNNVCRLNSLDPGVLPFLSLSIHCATRSGRTETPFPRCTRVSINRTDASGGYVRNAVDRHAANTAGARVS